MIPSKLMDPFNTKKNEFIMSLEDRSTEFEAEEQQAMKGVELIFSDKLNEAEDFFDELRIHHARFSLHHAEVAAFVALMSSDEDDVERAISLLSATEQLASQQAQKYSTHSNIKKVNEAVSSLKTWALGKMAKKGIAVGAAKAAAEDQENRAEGALQELVHLHRARRARLWALQIQAECYLMTSLLQIVVAGESWAGMVKLGLNLKKTASIYKHCEKKLKKISKEWVKMGGNFKVPEDLDDSDISDSDSEDDQKPSKGKGQLSKSRSLAERLADLDMDEDSGPSSSTTSSEKVDLKQLDALRDDQRMVLDTKKGIMEDMELSSLRIGLEFGIGAFNLICSLIPTTFQKASELIGMPCDRNKAMRLLQKAAATNHPRAPYAFVMLLEYHAVIMGLLPYADHHAKEAKLLIDKLQPQWRNGSILRMLLSRYERYEGMLGKAVETVAKNPMKADPYDISNRGCNQRLRNLMSDELAWCYLMQGEFVKAAELFGKLLKDTVFYKPFYACLQSSCLWEAGPSHHEQASALLRELPTLVSGKKQVGPLEQFGVRMAQEFSATNQAPCFPALELASMYNGFQHMDKVSLERHMDRIEAVFKNNGKTGDASSSGKGSFELKWNNSSKLLCKFLLGQCHKGLGDKQKAQDEFRHVVKNGDANNPGNVLPYSCYELAGLLLQDDVNSQEGLSLLDKAVGFAPHEFQTRLKFVISEMSKIYKPLNK